MSKSKGALLALLVMTTATCGEAPMVAAPGSTLTVIANPPFIVANGGVSVISALVIDPAGTPAANGTVVQFFSTLGNIEAQGQTKDGVARVNLVADARSGTATVTGATGDQSETVEIVIGSARPVLLTLTAEPLRVKPNRPVYLTANVFDEDGNPIANIPVIFRLEGGVGKETLDSGGAQVFTDNNGQAFDTLRTTSNEITDVTVTAETSNQVSDEVTIEVN